MISILFTTLTENFRQSLTAPVVKETINGAAVNGYVFCGINSINGLSTL